MLEIGDIVEARDEIWTSMFSKRANVSKAPPTGPVFWISPSGINRIMIKGCGWQFRQADVELLYVDVDVSEFD